MIDTLPTTASARDRLLIAAADLLQQAGGGDVSTRAICERAGVQAPTLYHYFPTKQVLLDEVVNHGFLRFLAKREHALTDDPIAPIRDGWNAHVEFGILNPGFYAHIYGRVQVGVRCAVVSSVEGMILEALGPAAAAHRLAVPAEVAAREILAASSGVILTLITTADGEQVDWGLSTRIRDAVLDSMMLDAPQSAAEVTSRAASLLSAALHAETGTLRPSEVALMSDWLSRLARHA